MDTLRELYQQVIIDHNNHPRNFHKMPDATQTAEGYNPLCGDQLELFLQIDNDCIQAVSFEGHGCAISIASTSLMTELLTGKTLAEAETLFQQFHALITDPNSKVDMDKLGKLAVLAGVKDYPSRIKCATLAWHALHAALHGDKKPVTTE